MASPEINHADAILARLKAQDRARLRIYIGAAPGVGKTYSMLQEAHALRGRGMDVVGGFIETYGRGDTEAQIKDLEVVPRLKFDLARGEAQIIESVSTGPA